MKKAAIPVLRSGNAATDRFAEAVKQNLEDMAGQHQNSAKMQPLTSDASLADVIAQCNLLLQRLQG